MTAGADGSASLFNGDAIEDYQGGAECGRGQRQSASNSSEYNTEYNASSVKNRPTKEIKQNQNTELAKKKKKEVWVKCSVPRSWPNSQTQCAAPYDELI